MPTMYLDEAVEHLLFMHDPIGINFGHNVDEYRPEMGTIVPRLDEAQSVDDMRHIVHEEFIRWFGEGIAGPATRYQGIAEELWELYRGWIWR